MSAPPKLCDFDLLPPRDCHPMDSWVPPGITSRYKRHFSFTESLPQGIASTKMSDNKAHANHIHLHTQTIPYTLGKKDVARKDHTVRRNVREDVAFAGL